MYVSTQHTVNTIGMHSLLLFAQAQFTPGFSHDVELTSDDIAQALLNAPETEIQQQVYDWFVTAKANVDALIFGYVARFSLSVDDTEKSVLPGLAADLMRYELCTNDGDESIVKRRDDAIKTLDKIDKGVIQLKAPTAKHSNTIKTAKPISQFNWSSY